jgi:MFS family permease
MTGSWLGTSAQRQLPKALAPLAHGPFFALWCSSLMFNLAAWMHIVTASWWMISTGQTAGQIALIPLGMNAPGVVLAIFSGVLCDRFGWRKVYLLAGSLFFLASGAIVAAFSRDMMTDVILVVLTFTLGSAAALRQPALQSSFAALVPKEHLLEAIALDSLNLNLGRCLGPSLAGLLISIGGMQLGFAVTLLFAVPTVVVALAIVDRRMPPTPRDARFLPALKEGALYCLHQPVLRQVYFLTFGFGALAMGIWVLVPVMFAVDKINNSSAFGSVLAFIGAGAIVGAALRSRLNSMAPVDKILPYAVLLACLAPAALSVHAPLYLVSGALFGFGIAWTTVYSTAVFLIQISAAASMKGRALSYYFTFAYLGWAFGSWLWGAAAGVLGVTTASGVSLALFCALYLWTARRFSEDMTKKETA